MASRVITQDDVFDSIDRQVSATPSSEPGRDPAEGRTIESPRPLPLLPEALRGLLAGLRALSGRP